MSTRVYLSTHTCQTTHKEDTPVCIRIQLSRATVKELHRRLQHAYQRNDVRLVRRTTVWLDLLVTTCPWRCSVHAGASAPPVSTTGVRPFCCVVGTVWSLTIAVGADRS